ncbi:response regulator [Leucobacter sp. gxy201]|uniref:response regulator transcription factor n=1 Tax=Leucobacter sp. gxy201 TaxID=2957200 RepID=UPI003DA05AE1
MDILIVEDDDRVAGALAGFLEKAGYATVRVAEGAAALAALNAETEAVLLDLGLPDMDGLDVCRRIRGVSSVPIIIATARSQVEERIKGLHAGADDFVVKPFDVRELVARLEAVTRRARTLSNDAVPSQSLDADGVQIDFASRVVVVDGVEAPLTPKEFDIVAVLARYPGVVVPSDRIIREVWGTDWSGFKRSLEVHLGSIRRKVAREGFIANARGVGYRLQLG